MHPPVNYLHIKVLPQAWVFWGSGLDVSINKSIYMQFTCKEVFHIPQGNRLEKKALLVSDSSKALFCLTHLFFKVLVRCIINQFPSLFASVVSPRLPWWLSQKRILSQSNLEKEEWNWKNQPAWLQTILQSHSHQDSVVLAQRQKCRSMEQNRKPRDKFTYLWTPYLQQRRQEYTTEKRL